ncbi:MAG: type II toxin-antitoxin system VapB family antitoxin [Acidobacteriales bacterium]|nr:type II toxin-antitoxin system VapB family antitoxin [Terriglobales bacterium]
MALNIKNASVERLAAEVAQLARESKTEAIRKALDERQQRLAVRRNSTTRRERMLRFLETAVWPDLPAGIRGKRVTKREKERILGYGPKGV